MTVGPGSGGDRVVRLCSAQVVDIASLVVDAILLVGVGVDWLALAGQRGILAGLLLILLQQNVRHLFTINLINFNKSHHITSQ